MTVSIWQRKELEDTLYKQLRTWTTPMVIALPANTPAQAKNMRYSLERSAADIGPPVNAYKTEYMRFNQSGDIPTLNDNFWNQWTSSPT